MDQTLSIVLQYARITYDLVANTAAAFAAPTANEKEAIVLWVEVGRVQWVTQGKLGAGYCRRHDYIQIRAG